MNLRLATPDEFVRFFGREPPDIWFGLPHYEGGEIVGMGVVHHDALGRAWGSLDAKKPLPALRMHRTAKRALAALREAGEPVLYVGCNRKHAQAEKWLLRLGFSLDAELHAEDDVRYWSMRLADV